VGGSGRGGVAFGCAIAAGAARRFTGAWLRCQQRAAWTDCSQLHWAAAAAAAAAQVVITKIRQLHTDAGLTTAQFQAMEGAIQAAWKAAGDSLRVRFQAMPHGLSLVW